MIVDGTTVLRRGASSPSPGIPRWYDESFPYQAPAAKGSHARVEILFEEDRIDGGWTLHDLWFFRKDAP